MNNFCTLFDSFFLARGLALYDSLKFVKEDFNLYILCLDDQVYTILKKIRLSNVILISMDDFETDELREVKKERSKVEYYWTTTPHLIRYVLDKFKLQETSYLDADLFFFQKPSVILDEFRESKSSVMITEHRYFYKYDAAITAGIYNVQFMTFKSDERGLKVLKWWQDRCTEWCFDRYEDGKMGDQKYLDHWTEMFEGVHVLKNIGGGVAPWNVQQYTVTPGPKVMNLPVIFYHFHAVKVLRNGKFDVGYYLLSKDVKKYIYQPYILCLQKQFSFIKGIDERYSSGMIQPPSFVDASIRFLYRKVKGNYNVIKG